MKTENDVVLVTGGSRGIGAAIATAFAGAGYDVAVGCHSESSLENGGLATADACRAAGVQADCFVGDVSDFSACKTVVDAVTARFGKIDVLVNNAGITRDGLLVKMSEENFDAVISTNLKGVFNMTRHAVRGMMRRRHGRIINISSVVGVYGNPGQANYAAAKAGVIGLTKTTAKELGKRGITCNAIAPGLIRSAMTDVLTDEQTAAILAAVTLGRFGALEDVAQAALFLASAGYITGQTLQVDGGLSM